MHVGIVSTIPFPDNVFGREQARALVDLGHEVTVLSPFNERSNWPLVPGVGTCAIDWTHEGATALQRQAIERDLDILHVHLSRGFEAPPRTLVPAVAELRTISLRRTPLRQILTLASATRLRRYLVGSANRKLVGRGRPADFYAPNGYSSWALDVLEARRTGGTDPFLAVYQGTLSATRNLPDLLRALREVRSAEPRARLRLISYMDVPVALVDTVSRLGLADAVEIVRATGPDPLVDSLSQAAISISWVPRVLGFDHQPPLKVLDSLAAGVPVLATDTMATRELLADGGGRCVPARPMPFSSAWLALLSDLSRGAVPRMASHPRFLHERSWETIMRDYWIPRYRAACGAGNPRE